MIFVHHGPHEWWSRRHISGPVDHADLDDVVPGITIVSRTDGAV